MTSIRQATPPGMTSPNVPLMDKQMFEDEIFHKGYDVILEHAIECPCKGRSGAPVVTCRNCAGTGWIFVNPLKTKAIISSINKDTKFKYWSPELKGTISITVRDQERFSYMDKITFVTGTNIFSEVKHAIDIDGDKKFIFCSYIVKKINSIFLFDTENTKLIRLTSDQYSVKDSNQTIVEITGFSSLSSFNGAVSIDYEHEISYNVIDQPHDFRSSFTLDENGTNTERNMPVQAIAQKSHIIFGNPNNYAGDDQLKNDWEPALFAPTYTVTQPTLSVKSGTITVTNPAADTGYEYSSDGGINFGSSPVMSGLVSNRKYRLVVRRVTTGEMSTPISIQVNATPVPTTPVISITEQPTISVPTGTLEVTSPVGLGYQYSLDGITYQSGTTFAGLTPSTSYSVLCRMGSTPPVSLRSNIVTFAAVPAP